MTLKVYTSKFHLSSVIQGARVMPRIYWGCILFVSLALGVSETAVAQRFRRPFDRCCETCTFPEASCCCTQTNTVLQTQLRSQQVVTYSEQTETHLRNESVVENVPRTIYQSVTVDQGSYQMVWVPKPVTKTIAKTVVQQQVRTRAVPYQLTRRVPQISTQLVPVQSLENITETIPLSMPLRAAAPNSQSWATGPQVMSNPLNYPASSFQSAPIESSVQTMPAIIVPMPGATISSPSMTEHPNADQWQTVTARPTSGSRHQNNEKRSFQTVPQSADDLNSRNSLRTSTFATAPSAARVWIGKRDLPLP